MSDKCSGCGKSVNFDDLGNTESVRRMMHVKPGDIFLLCKKCSSDESLTKVSERFKVLKECFR